MNQTASYYIKLPLKTAFFSVLLLFLEKQVLAHFKHIKFKIEISKLPNFSMEGDEGDILSKAPDSKPFVFV